MAVKDRWEEFGEWLSTERGKAEVTQKLVAIKAAISPVQLNRIENGNSGVKRQTVIDIVEAINDHSVSGYKVNLEEALNRAGFATGAKGKPQNAVQFARSEVSVTTAWGPDGIHVEIADDGPGFPPQVLARIGEPYVSSRGGAAAHMGLGIFIAQTLLERTGANVTFGNRSETGGGAAVSVRWPNPVFKAT